MTDRTIAEFNLMENGGQRALAVWLRSNEVFLQGTLDLAQELLSFGQARLDDDLNTLKTLMICHDFGEMAECQKQFAEKAATQYMDEASKLTSKLTDMITSATAPVRDEAAAHSRA
jgi:hypothetical protein